MKKKIRQPLDSGLNRLSLVVTIDSLSYEYSATLTGEQSLSLQRAFAYPEELKLPQNTKILLKSWERLSPATVGLQLQLEVEKQRTYQFLLLATLTSLPKSSSQIPTDGCVSNQQPQQEKPPLADESMHGERPHKFDLEGFLNDLIS